MGKILNRKTGITIVAILVCLLIALFLRIYFSSRIVQAFVSPVEVMVNGILLRQYPKGTAVAMGFWQWRDGG